MLAAMDAVKINAKDFVDPTRPVIECASRVANDAARLLRSGATVIVSVVGVRGVSSSFFNVILSAVAEALSNDFSDGRFSVETETPTQTLVFKRSLDAFAKQPSNAKTSHPPSS